MIRCTFWDLDDYHITTGPSLFFGILSTHSNHCGENRSSTNWKGYLGMFYSPRVHYRTRKKWGDYPICLTLVSYDYLLQFLKKKDSGLALVAKRYYLCFFSPYGLAWISARKNCDEELADKHYGVCTTRRDPGCLALKSDAGLIHAAVLRQITLKEHFMSSWCDYTSHVSLSSPRQNEIISP